MEQLNRVDSEASGIKLTCWNSRGLLLDQAYCIGEVCTTVDYVLVDIEAVSLMSFCHSHPMEDLNTSDHFPLTVSLKYRVCPQDHCRAPD